MVVWCVPKAAAYNHKLLPIFCALCTFYLFVVTESLRECREYRDKMIRDGMYKMMSSPNAAAEKMISSPGYAADALTTQDDAGYRSADSLTGESPRYHKQSSSVFDVYDSGKLTCILQGKHLRLSSIHLYL